MADIVALGEILIDFMQTAVSDDGYPTIKAQPGGALQIFWRHGQDAAAPAP